MRKYLILFLLLFPPGLLAQNITRLEYFIDIDPGYGKGTEIQITPADFLDLNLLIPVDELDNGFHILFVRAFDDRSIWSTTFIRPFLKGDLQRDELQTIVLLEYFIDTDPGYEKGTPIIIPDPSNSMDTTFTADLTGVPDGYHTIYFRAKDKNGSWSQVLNRPFVIGIDLPDIIRVEYFLDTDPGYGKATPIDFVAANELHLSQNLDLSAAEPGFHTAYIRAKDETGTWSQTFIHPFIKGSLQTDSLPGIEKVEYFIDKDPGFGSGIEIPPGLDSHTLDLEFIADMSEQDTGKHVFYARAMDKSGNWSMVYNEDFMVCQSYEIKDTMEICNGDSILISGVWRRNAGMYYDSLLTNQGCDSVIISCLQVNPVFEIITDTIICQGDSVFTGVIWIKESGVYYDSLQTIYGCDSILITDLKVNPLYEFSLTQFICAGDSILAGVGWQKETGIYYDSLNSICGCDSVIITSLGVTIIDTSITQTVLILTASQTGAGYQWISCPTNSAITGATGQSFQPESTGAYRVAITYDGCSDTSSCHRVNITGISENLLPGYIRIYPNPATDKLNVEINRAVSGRPIYKITDIVGSQVDNGRLNPGSNVIDLHALPSGVYFLSLEIESKLHIAKIIITKQ